jgi:hypothetical protein
MFQCIKKILTKVIRNIYLRRFLPLMEEIHDIEIQQNTFWGL